MPRMPAWAKEDIALSGRAYAGRIGLYERAESPMVSIAQAGALGFFITCILILLPFQGAFAAVKPPRALPWAMYLLPFQGVPLLLKHMLFELAKLEKIIY